jgi:transcriptional regulator GlxA family with amidase domain
MGGSVKRIGVLGFDKVNALDLTGPLEAFTNANELAGGAPLYELLVIGLEGKTFAAESGVLFKPHCAAMDAPPLDTLIVPGGCGLRQPRVTAAAADWLRRRAPATRRVASVCTGAFGLAAAGLLDGRRATTHWRFAPRLAQQFPALQVDARPLYVKDGKYYTGGGITAGIDLALALIEEDFGAGLALATAREMIVYLKRPGGQEQYSEPLQAQVRGGDRFAELVAWIDAHLGHDLSVEALAQRACLGARQFNRRFQASLGCTPARYVEDARMREACRRLSLGRRPIGAIAGALGFRSDDVFRRAFERRFGITPSHYRERFSPARARRSPSRKQV